MSKYVKYTGYSDEVKHVDRDFLIRILKRYHNSLFYIPLGDEEANRILDYIIDME